MILYSKSDLEKFVGSVKESIEMTKILLEKDRDNIELESMLNTLEDSLKKYKEQLKDKKEMEN